MVATPIQTSNLLTLLARDGGDVPNLGTIMMMEIRQSIAISPDDLIALWQLHNLPQVYLPRPRTARDAFRKAAPRNRPQDGLTLIEYRGAAKQSDGLDLACVLTRSTDARSKIALVHRNRAVIGLDEQGALVIVEPSTGLTDQETRYCETIRQQFRHIQQHIDGDQIRGALGRVMRDAQAVWIHDGTWVIPQTREATAVSVAAVIRDLNGYLPCGVSPNRLVTIQYTDTPEQRQQLREQIQEHVRREIEAKLVEIVGYQKNRAAGGKPIGERKQESALAEIARLGELIVEYETVLRESLAPVHHFLQMQQTLLERELAG